MHPEESKEAIMSDLVFVCSNCTLEFGMDEQRYANPSSAFWCPFCGGTELHRVDTLEPSAAVPREAA
jgi:transcription initiation factor IIE alpha subunit